MPRVLLFLAIIFCLFSCQKEFTYSDGPDNFMSRLYSSLKDSARTTDWARLDWQRVKRLHLGNDSTTLVQIAFRNQAMENDFVLVQVDDSGAVLRGRMIHIEPRSSIVAFEGEIILSSLLGKRLVKSKIEQGRITAYYETEQKLSSQADPFVTLPEVIFVSSYSNGSAYTVPYYLWMNFLDFGGNGDPGNGTGYYGAGGSYGGGTGGGSSSGTVPVPYTMIDVPAILIDFENQYADPAIDLESFISCFTVIPDAGATCKITIMTDIPVDSDPSQFFDWENGSPGHTWLRFEKNNGTQSASQHIGFYPKEGWKTTISPAPIPGKFVNNQYHEFNASYELTITPAELHRGLMEMLQRKNMNYDIDDNNCTDWSIQVFNATVNPTLALSIPLIPIPGGEAPNGTSTPQGLYMRLTQMNVANTPGVNLPKVGFSGASTGPCQ